MKQNKKIKVAFFSHTHDLKTGGNNSLLNLIDELAKRDVKCFVFVPEQGEFAEALSRREVQYTIVPHLFWIYGLPENEWSLRAVARRAKKIAQRGIFFAKHFRSYVSAVKKWQPDLLYTNTTAIFEGAILSWWLGIPHLWHVRELKGLEFGYDLGNGLFKFLFKQADAQIFVSYTLKGALLGYYDPAKAHVVHNGIPAPASILSKVERHRYTFAMVGRLQSRKKPDIAIEAVAQLKSRYPNIRLLLAGGAHPTYLAFLKNIVHSLSVEDIVIFVGEVDDPYATVYSQADAYLMCSTNETFGRVTVEAMLAKLPVVGYKSEITGTKEIIENEVTGLLYEGGVAELVACMERFILNPTWAESLGRNGYQVAQEKFSVEQYADAIYRIIHKQIERI